MLVDSIEKLRHCDVESLDVMFTLPGGSEIELKKQGATTQVTSANLDEYIHLVSEAIAGTGVEKQIASFRHGFSKLIPISDLSSFSASELVILLSGEPQEWTIGCKLFFIQCLRNIARPITDFIYQAGLSVNSSKCLSLLHQKKSGSFSSLRRARQVSLWVA